MVILVKNYKKRDVKEFLVLLGTPGIVEALSDYMTLLTNYSIYKKLFEIDDLKLYMKILSLQNQCTLIILYNNLPDQPRNFLSTLCFPKKRLKLTLKTFRSSWVSRSKIKTIYSRPKSSSSTCAWFNGSRLWTLTVWRTRNWCLRTRISWR